MKTIVVATDLGSQSEAALEYARKLAGAYGARIVLAHGVDPLDYAAVDDVPGRLRKELTDAARAALDKLCGDLLRRRHSQPFGDSPGRGGTDAGGRGAAI